MLFVQIKFRMTSTALHCNEIKDQETCYGTQKRQSTNRTIYLTVNFSSLFVSSAGVDSSWHACDVSCRKSCVIVSHIFVHSHFISSTSVIALWYISCFMCPQTFSIGLDQDCKMATRARVCPEAIVLCTLLCL